MRNVRIAGLALAVMFAAGCTSMPFGIGDMDSDFVEWDLNKDGRIADNEFDMGFDNSGWFDDWDSDNDGLLSDSEFRVGSSAWGLGANTFPEWDVDNDGFLEEDEFGDGLFGTWDRNDDGFLDDNEFGLGMDWFT